jgi:hypothetical protein
LYIRIVEFESVEYTLVLPIRDAEEIAAAGAFDDGLFQYVAKPAVCE